MPVSLVVVRLLWAGGSAAEPKWCTVHANKNQTVDLRHPRCRIEGCQKHPTFGPPPSSGAPSAGERLYCLEHKTADSINLKNRRSCRSKTRCAWDKAPRESQTAKDKDKDREALAAALADEQQQPPPRCESASGSQLAAAADRSKILLDSSEGDPDSMSGPSLPPSAVLAFTAATHTPEPNVGGGLSPGRDGSTEARSGSCGVSAGHAVAAYQSPVTKWLRYCQELVPAQGLASICPAPASQEAVLGFIEYLKQEDRVHADSLPVYLAAINNYHQDLGYARPALGPQIRQARKEFVAAKLQSLKDRAGMSVLKGDSSVSADSCSRDSQISSREAEAGSSVSSRCTARSAGGLERRWRCCSSPVAKWIQYCINVKGVCPVPASQVTVRGFITFLQQEGRVHAESVNVYFSAINLLHRDLGYERPAVRLFSSDAAAAACTSTGARPGPSPPSPPVTRPLSTPLSTLLSPSSTMVLANADSDRSSEVANGGDGGKGACLVTCGALDDAVSATRHPSRHECAALNGPGSSSSVGGRGGGVPSSSCPVTFRAWKLSGSKIASWIRFCQVVLPSMGQRAVPAVPAARAVVFRYLGYLLNTQHVHADSLWQHVAAINNLQESLGYARPLPHAHASTPVSELFAPLGAAINSTAIGATYGRAEFDSAQEKTQAAGDRGEEAAAEDDLLRSPLSCGVGSGSGCSVTLHTRGGCSPPPLTPIPPPMLPADPPGASPGSDFSV